MTADQPKTFEAWWDRLVLPYAMHDTGPAKAAAELGWNAAIEEAAMTVLKAPEYSDVPHSDYPNGLLNQVSAEVSKLKTGTGQ